MKHAGLFLFSIALAVGQFTSTTAVAQAAAAPADGGGGGGAAPAASASNIPALFTSGIIISGVVGANRVSSVKFIPQTGGGVYAQASGNDNVQAGIVFTADFVSPKFSVAASPPGKNVLRYVADISLCGPFAFLKGGPKGCGPVILGAATSGSSSVIGQVGAGWAVDAGPLGSTGKNVAFSIGALINPSDTVLDTKVVNPHTYMVNPAFDTAATNGTVSATITQPTVGIFGMVSVEF